MDPCCLCMVLGVALVGLAGLFFSVWLIGLLVSSPAFWVGLLFLLLCLFVGVSLSNKT